MAVPRDGSYIWVTWITGLLSGDRQCLWSAWYRAHFKDYERKPTSFDLAAWTAQHNEMVRTRAEALRAGGHEVYVEDQNKFSLRGRAATLGGKPDLVAVRGPADGRRAGGGGAGGRKATAGAAGGVDPGDREATAGAAGGVGPGGRAADDGGERGREALVIDCKSGKQRNSDYFQVLAYMLVLPLTHPACRGLPVAGEIQYRGTSVRIEPEKLTDGLKQLIRTTIEQVGGDAEPARVPSSAECRFCDLCVPDCPDRIDEDDSDDASSRADGAGVRRAGSSGVGHDLF